MEITIIGSWILLGLGTLLVLATIHLALVAIHLAPDERKNLVYIILLIFGVLCAGVGIHGPLFMGQYAKWLETMLSIVKMEDPDSETYRIFLERIARGDFDPELQEIALNYLRNHPTQDMDSLLTEAINSATNDQEKEALRETQLALAKEEIIVLATTMPNPYTEFLSTVSPMVKASNSKTYQMVLDKIGKGGFDPELQEIALSYALDRPITNMDSLLTEAINSATDDQGKEALIRTKQELVAKIGTAKLLSQKLSLEEIETLDPATRMLVANELLTKPPNHEPNRSPASNLRLREQPDQLKQKLER